MKRLVWILIPILLVVIFLLKPDTKELNVLIWDNYLAENTITNFEKLTDSHINLELFKSNEEALAKIKTNPGVYDIVVPSDYMVKILVDEGLVTKLDHSKIPNINNVSAQGKGKYFDPALTSSVPYAFGASGFAVNTKFVQEKELTWKQLSDPKFKGHIVVMDDMRYVLGSVLIELGFDPNTTKKEEIAKAVELFKTVLPNISKITPDTPVDLMVAEGAWISYGYSGDSFQMHDQNPAISFLFPKAGALQFVDNLVIPKDAPANDLAHQFINYILEPQVAADITMATNFGTFNAPSLSLVKEEVRKNTSVFPPANVLSSMQFIKDLGDNLSLYDQAWQEVKQGS